MGEAIYEARARRTIIERVVSGLSEHGVDVKATGGGNPDYTPADYAAALGNIESPMAAHLFWGGYMGDRKARTNLVERLHLWGWQRWAERGRPGKIDVLLHGRLAGLAVFEQTSKPVRHEERLRSLGVGELRWRALRDHYADLRGCLQQVDDDLSWHLIKRLKQYP